MSLIVVLGAPALTLPAGRSGDLADPPYFRCCVRTAFAAAPASTRHNRAATTEGRETRRAALRSIRAAHGSDGAPGAHSVRKRCSQNGGRTFVRLIPRADGFDLATARVALRTARGQNLTLVATIHLGERRYFEELQADLERHDTVLYELVIGKEYTQAARGSMRRLEARVEPSPAQVLFSRKYGLEHQLEVMRMEDRDAWFIADLDRDEMLALREQSLAQLSRHYVRGVENPAWIQAATALRCALLCVNGPHPFHFLAYPSTYARTHACSHARVHKRTIAHTHTHTSRDAMEQWFQSGGGGSQAEVKWRTSLYLAAVVAAFLPCPEVWGLIISWLLRSSYTGLAVLIIS